MKLGQNYVAYFWENIIETVSSTGNIVKIELSPEEVEYWKNREYEKLEGYESLIKLGILKEKETARTHEIKSIWDKVQIEITEKCNLNCVHCYLGHKKPKHMSLEKAKQILKECLEKGVKIIEYSGGEPALYPELENLAGYGKELGFFQILFTNGTIRINPEYFDIIQVSIDGPKDVHEKIRGKKGIFEKILENLEYYKKHTKTIVSTIVFKSTSVKDLLELGEKIKTHHRIAPPVPCGYSKCSKEELISCYHTCIEYAKIKGLPSTNKFKCFAGKRFVYYDVYGNKHPCPLLKNVSFERWLKKLSVYERICEDCEGCFIPCPAYRFYLGDSVNPWCKRLSDFSSD